MKYKNLIILIIGLFTMWVIGCSKDSTKPTSVDPVIEAATTDEFTQNLEETFGANEELPSSADYNDQTFQKQFDFGKLFTYDSILRWGRFVVGWQRTVTYTVNPGDTTADVNIDLTQTSATFHVRGIIGPDTIVTVKPFIHPIHRKAKAVKRANRWFLNEITGGFGQSDGNTDMDIVKIEIAPVTNIPSSGIITIDNPQDYYFKVGALRQVASGLVPVVNPLDTVKVTVWVTGATDTDLVFLHYGVFRHNDGRFLRARKPFVRDAARDGEGPVGSIAFTQSYRAHRLPFWRNAGRFHAGIDLMRKGTIWQNESLQPDYDYKSAAYVIPYYVIR